MEIADCCNGPGQRAAAERYAALEDFALRACFRFQPTGPGTSALVRLFGEKRDTQGCVESDAGAIVITRRAGECFAPVELEEQALVGVYPPNEWTEEHWSNEVRTFTGMTVREAIAWGMELTSHHEAISRLPAHWEE